MQSELSPARKMTWRKIGKVCVEEEEEEEMPLERKRKRVQRYITVKQSSIGVRSNYLQ